MESMWYLAEILFAESPQLDRAEYHCESCDVLLQAMDASRAYDKAVAWGVAYTADTQGGLRLLGVSHLTTIGEQLADGTEICGKYFQAPAVWDRVGELIPPPEELKAIKWERSSDIPVGELLNPEQFSQLKREMELLGQKSSAPLVAKEGVAAGEMESDRLGRERQQGK